MSAAAGINNGNINDERMYLDRILESRERSENKALMVYFFGALLVITGAAMTGAQQCRLINAGWGAVFVGAVSIFRGMKKYDRS